MPADSLESGNLGIQESGNLGIQKKTKMKILRMQIRSAQNVGKVQISRKQTTYALLCAISDHFSTGQKLFLLILTLHTSPPRVDSSKGPKLGK